MRLKLSLLGSASVAALMLATSAQAADLSRPVYKAPVTPSAPPWSWTGFYVGGTVGGVSDHSSITNDPGSATPWLTGAPTTSATGVIGGLEAGYNWQISQLVLGIEADASWSSARQSVVAGSLAGSDTYKSGLSSLATIRGRVGWAFDRALLYGTGGVAFANLKDQLADTAFAIPFTATPSSSTTGWTAGAGIEYALTDHWTAKAEYLHVGFPTRTAAGGVGLGYVFDFKDRLDIGRVGINYKF